MINLMCSGFKNFSMRKYSFCFSGYYYGGCMKNLQERKVWTLSVDKTCFYNKGLRKKDMFKVGLIQLEDMSNELGYVVDILEKNDKKIYYNIVIIGNEEINEIADVNNK